MSYDPRDSALGRLEQFDDRFVEPPYIPDGSPGAQLFGALFFPGIAAMRRHPMTGLLLFSFGVLAPVALLTFAYVNRANLIGFALNPQVLWLAVGTGVAIVLTRMISIFEIANAFRYSRGISGKATVTFMILLLGCLPVLYGVYKSNEARAAVGNVFSGGSSEPLFVPEGEIDDGGGVRNILLLGGDSGPGRWGMRTDTMIVASIDRASGRMALVSVPRNLVHLQFPPGSPMGQQFPDGYRDNDGSLTNAIFTYLGLHPEIESQYARDGLLPQAVALSEGIGYSLGITIDDYALVNMEGFADIIDAVGGVTINVEKQVPLPPVPGADLPPTIGPGEVFMNGDLAIAYVRSRKADSDYARMARQRELLAALGSQVSGADAARGFSSVTGALDNSMRTSLTASEFSDLLARMNDASSIGESIGLSPPLVTTGNPDYNQIKVIMDAVENYVRTGVPSGYAS